MTTYTATARLATADITTAADPSPTRTAWLLADMLAQLGQPIDPDVYQKLRRRGFVHVGYTAEGKELFYAVDSVME